MTRFGEHPDEGTCEKTSDGLHVWVDEGGNDKPDFCYACNVDHPTKKDS